MSYQDLPRRPRSSRHPALAQDEDSYQSYQDTQAGYSYQDGYSGFAGLTSQGTREQRAPWETPAQQAPWDTPAQQTQQATWDASAQQTTWGEYGQQNRWDTTAQDDADLSSRASGPYYATPDDESEGTGRRSALSRRARSRGRLAGSVAGFLAAAVAIGVANLVAAYVRPQASPVIAVGGWFIDHTPPALKNFAVEKFGENDKTMLLLGMYVTIAIIAIVIGMLAWRRIGIGVAGIGLFGLFGAYIAITRPESHVTDVIPSIVGGIVGIAAIVLLVRMGATKSAVSAAWTNRTTDGRRHAAWTGGNS
jgi:hypothetical protein